MSDRRLSPAEVRVRAARARRRRSLSLDAIVDVALNIVDTQGTEAVTMRRVAAEFDTGPASLYAYVANRDELLQHVLTRVVDEARLPEGDTWQEKFRFWAMETRRVLTSHGDAARLTFGTIPVTPKMLQGAEILLGAMIEAGVPPKVAAYALDISALYVGADVFEGWLMSKRFDDGSGRPPEEVGMEYFQEVAEGLADLPADRFPYLTGNLEVLRGGDGHERFEFGLDMLIAGFAAQITP